MRSLCGPLHRRILFNPRQRDCTPSRSQPGRSHWTAALALDRGAGCIEQRLQQADGGPRVYAQMARDGVMPKLLDFSSGVPRAAIVLQGLLSLIVVCGQQSGRLDQLLRHDAVGVQRFGGGSVWRLPAGQILLACGGSSLDSGALVATGTLRSLGWKTEQQCSSSWRRGLYSRHAGDASWHRCQWAEDQRAVGHVSDVWYWCGRRYFVTAKRPSAA